MTVWDGLSDIGLETVYVDYVSRQELLIIKRTMLNHDRDDFMSINGKSYRILNIDTQFDTDAAFVRRSIFIVERQ